MKTTSRDTRIHSSVQKKSITLIQFVRDERKRCERNARLKHLNFDITALGCLHINDIK